MGQRSIPIAFGDITGGESYKYPVSKTPWKYSRKLQNCHISERGGIAKIPGYAKVNVNDTGTALKSGCVFRKSDGTERLLAAGGGNIYEFNESTSQLNVLHPGLDANAKVDFEEMNDLCIMVNGSAQLKYDGTVVTALGGTPPATAFKACAHKGRMWMIETADRLMATHSALRNPEDYITAGDAGYIDFKFVLGRGDELLDIFSYIDLIVFLFRNHLVLYSGSNPTATGDFVMAQKIEGTGVMASDVCLPTGTDIAYLSDSGIKTLRQVVTTGKLNLNDLSEHIDPVLRPLIEANKGGNFSVAHYSPRGWLMFHIGETVWIYSYTHKAWGRMVGADINGMFGTIDGGVYLCGTGFLYEYGTGWDFAGASPKMVWEDGWKRYRKSGGKVYPKIMEITMHPEAQTVLDFSIAFNLNPPAGAGSSQVIIEPSRIVHIDDVTDWDALLVIDETYFANARIPLFGSGGAAQVVFRNVSVHPVEISDLVMHVTFGEG